VIALFSLFESVFFTSVYKPTSDLQFDEIAFATAHHVITEMEKECAFHWETSRVNSQWDIMWKWSLPDGGVKVKVQQASVAIINNN